MLRANLWMGAIVMAAILAGCNNSDDAALRLNLPQSDYPCSFTQAPFVHPAIIKDLTTWISDGGDQVVSIDLLGAHSANRYYGDVHVTNHTDGSPSSISFPEDHGEWFLYSYVGVSESGVHVLRTVWSGGGSGKFVNLLFLTIERDRGFQWTADRWDWGQRTIRADRSRLLIRKWGEIGLGDRWNGDLSIRGNELFIGTDDGWFTKGGTGGGDTVYDRRDRVIQIDADP